MVTKVYRTQTAIMRHASSLARGEVTSKEILSFFSSIGGILDTRSTETIENCV